jgi:hypothetical protein
MIALAAAFLLQAAASAPQPLDQAIAVWKRLCVDPLPAKQGFIDAFNFDQRNGVKWVKVNPPGPGLTLGHYWRSPLGTLSYVSEPELPEFVNDPACHYTFAVEPGYTHEAGVVALRQAFGIDTGKTTGSRRKPPQTQWEVDWKPGMHVRIFLSADDEQFGVPGARLSISVQRAKKGDR